MSFWSRLASWLPSRKPAVPEPTVATGTPPSGDLDASAGPTVGEEPAVSKVVPASPSAVASAPTPRIRRPKLAPQEPAPETAPSTLRLGVDFGTSTTQVAVHLPGQAPRLIRLDGATDSMPSYMAIGLDSTPVFGATAVNVAPNAHSIKLKLEKDEPLHEVGGRTPSRVAFLMLEETVRRTIEQLRRQRLIPPDMERLEIATNFGCTPMFGLDLRIRLRNIAAEAGLNVTLTSLIEEPVAAAYEVMLSGLVSEGRVLVIDMGGGTLDIAVIKISDGAQKFELFASKGYPRGGDAFTEIIDKRLRQEVADRTASDLSRADSSLIWQRAEAAKLTLSARLTVKVDLSGIADMTDVTCELTREWFTHATGNLRVLVKHDVTTVYRMARLVLDRGGEHDPRPGSVDFDEPVKGRIRRLTDVGLHDDGLEHLDHVVLVGGGTNMPMIEAMFRDIFGDLVIGPEAVGLERDVVVCTGLARPKPTQMVSLRYPSWGVSVVADDGQHTPLYEPYAPAFNVVNGMSTEYRYEVKVPKSRNLALAFRSVDGAGVQWPAVAIPNGTTTLRFAMTLFGQFDLHTDVGTVLYSDRDGGVPWQSAEGSRIPAWLPPWRQRDWWSEMPMWDMRNDK